MQSTINPESSIPFLSLRSKLPTMAVSTSHYSHLQHRCYNPELTQSDIPTLPLHFSLRRVELFLRFLGFIHDSRFSLSLSSLSFLFFGVGAPSLVIIFFYCGSSDAAACRKYHVKSFELETLFFQATAAAVSLLCFSRSFRKYGLRIFLFVDKYHEIGDEFHFEYIPKINDFFRSLAVWVLPCVILKMAREVVRVIYVQNDSLVQSMMVVFVLLVSWTYTATVYLTGSTLFSLVCSLQVMHFENYKKLLERNLDVLVYIEEHSRLTFNLSKISHRFRIFLILEFLIVTASQVVTLLETTGNSGTINFINAADFAVSLNLYSVPLNIWKLKNSLTGPLLLNEATFFFPLFSCATYGLEATWTTEFWTLYICCQSNASAKVSTNIHDSLKGVWKDKLKFSHVTKNDNVAYIATVSVILVLLVIIVVLYLTTNVVLRYSFICVLVFANCYYALIILEFCLLLVMATWQISSIVQVVGIIICLHAAAKISHRAESLASFASRWHALLTCHSNETLGASENGGNFNFAGSAIAAMNYPESDMESVDYTLPSMNVELNSNVSSYLKRQAFVMYMQANPGGVTIFGWTVNRAFMDTIFCVELTMVTFVLGKTLTFTTNNT